MQREKRVSQLGRIMVCVALGSPLTPYTTAFRGPYRESSTPRSNVDGVLLFTDTFQTGQGRLLRAVTSSGTPTLSTTPIRSPRIRGTPSMPSWLPRLLLLPPLKGNA